VLEHAASLRKLDLAGVEPLTSPAETVNRMDEDVVRPGLPTEALMKMAPDKDPPFVKVPKVLGEGGGA
jgi:aspartyl-tRNA(Asn)/glutamyl-tRNA(Gln) amidotransferase subunit C